MIALLRIETVLTSGIIIKYIKINNSALFLFFTIKFIGFNLVEYICFLCKATVDELQ